MRCVGWLRDRWLAALLLLLLMHHTPTTQHAPAGCCAARPSCSPLPGSACAAPAKTRTYVHTNQRQEPAWCNAGPCWCACCGEHVGRWSVCCSRHTRRRHTDKHTPTAHHLQERCGDAGARVRLRGQVPRAVAQLVAVVVPAKVGLVAVGGEQQCAWRSMQGGQASEPRLVDCAGYCCCCSGATAEPTTRAFRNPLHAAAAS